MGLSWNVQDDSERQIASINLSDFEGIRGATAELFQADAVPYSGIILSNKSELTTGETIEGNCYKKGGFKFVYKSYDRSLEHENFPTKQFASLISKLGSSYLHSVKSQKNVRAELDVAWAVCQKSGDYGTMHNHVSNDEEHGTRYSGMLYLQCPDSINPKTFPDGCLHIVVDNNAFFFPPVPGSLVIWPAWMLHGIHPFKGDGERLGIAFDFNCIKKEN